MLTPEQEALRNALAQEMMGGGGDQNTINQFYALTEGMRRDPYGDAGGGSAEGFGGIGGTGPTAPGYDPGFDPGNYGITGPTSFGPTGAAPTGAAPTGTTVGGGPAPQGGGKGNTDPAITSYEVNAIMGEQPGSIPGNPQGAAIDLSGYAPTGTITGSGLGTQSTIQQGIDQANPYGGFSPFGANVMQEELDPEGGKSSHSKGEQPAQELAPQVEDPLSSLQDPEALSAYAMQTEPEAEPEADPQGYDDLGYDGFDGLDGYDGGYDGDDDDDGDDDE
jgi:hypothetical protein